MAETTKEEKVSDSLLEKLSQNINVRVIKKDGTKEEYNIEKIQKAVMKAAERVCVSINEEDMREICVDVYCAILGKHTEEVTVEEMHNLVEQALDNFNKKVAESYRNYRNYKQDFVHMLDRIYKETQRIMYVGDVSNANADSTLVSTKRSLVHNNISEELYKKFFLTTEELQASNEGYIYIHDKNGRQYSTNCCLVDMKSILKDGFELGNVKYTEPKTLPVAFGVISDITMSMASQQYGGYSICEVDKLLAPYAEKTYNKYLEKYLTLGVPYEKADEQAMADVKRDFEQGFQQWEIKWNTLNSSRGDYIFVTTSFGLGTGKFERMANEAILRTRREGQGVEGHKKPVLFPKLIFLYDENLHGEGKELEETFNQAIECSKKAMYPDYISLSGDNYVSQMYKKYGKPITAMGCRSFLSPWYERGGMNPADENDTPIFEGRGNIGVVSLNLPMIYMKAKQENKDFYEVLDYYLELIRNLHIRTMDYLGEMKASTNPLGYMEGGFYGGHLKADDKIKPVLKSFTTSFGITALNELQRLYNKKSIVEDGEFALKVMKYIADKVEQFKKEDGILHSCYGTPAESLCKTQVDQFKLKYGIIENVSDREYMTNSFHCHVSEDITPIEKQDLEGRFIDLCKGGQIFFTRFNCDYNTLAFKTIVRRAMKKGFYAGTNLNLAYCEDCGKEEVDMKVCPKCGSTNITVISRVCGYLGYEKVKGHTRYNAGKYAETQDRVSY